MDSLMNRKFKITTNEMDHATKFRLQLFFGF